MAPEQKMTQKEMSLGGYIEAQTDFSVCEGEVSQVISEHVPDGTESAWGNAYGPHVQQHWKLGMEVTYAKWPQEFFCDPCEIAVEWVSDSLSKLYNGSPIAPY